MIVTLRNGSLDVWYSILLQVIIGPCPCLGAGYFCLSAAGVSFITQRRSVAKSVGCFQRRLFVCLFVRHVNAMTPERVNKHGMMQLGR